MKKYSEITLTDEEKKIVEWFKSQGYTHIGRTTTNGFIECFDENNDIRCNLKPMRKPFEFIENGERYEIEKLLNPPHEPKTVLELKDGDAYWWIDSCGSVFNDRWDNDGFDVDRRIQGNVFLTEEEAEFEKKRREVVAMVRKHARPFIYKRNNFYLYFDMSIKRIRFSSVELWQFATDYFESVEDIKQAIAEVGEEYFKKYYLGVTDNA